MYRSRDPIGKGNKKYEVLKHHEEKKCSGEKSKYVNVSYHIRKLFSYCDADIVRIENNLIIYNSIIDNIKKNGNKIIKKEVERIIREKDKNEKFCLKEMKEDEYKIINFDLKKVELDFKFIECSLCFELIKFICIQECNHTYCFLCFYRLLYMEKKENSTENNQTSGTSSRNDGGSARGSNTYNNSTRSSGGFYRSQVNNRSYPTGRSNFGMLDSMDIFADSGRSSISRRDKKDEKYNYEFDKEKMKCPFCKERNEYIFFCLNNFYTYFTYNNLLKTLLEKEDEQNFSAESIDFTEFNDQLRRNDLSKGYQGDDTKREMNEEVKVDPKKGTNNGKANENVGESPFSTSMHKVGIESDANGLSHMEKVKRNTINKKYELNEKNDLKKVFSSYYDDIIILRNILKMSNVHDDNTISKSSKITKKTENMYLFFYYEKYIRRKKEKIPYLQKECVNSQKRYAFYSKIFVDTENKIFYEYFFIYSLSKLLTSYVCLLSPCIDHWIKVQNKKVEKFKLNHKTDKYFENIYIDNKKEILRKKNDSIYDKYHQYTKNIFNINDEESEISDDYFKVVDIFFKACFTNLDNVSNLSHLKNYCYNRLNELSRHIGEHNKTYCDICVENNDNNFLFEYNIFHKKSVSAHIEYGEKISETKYKIRHIYCHLCGFYLYDFDAFMNHINKYHFFCKFCFNKRPSDSKEPAKGDVDDVVYYDQLHLHVSPKEQLSRADYESLFEHYKKKHHPCLYEQCIFVVFDNKIDLCFHLAEKHEEKGSNKRNKITLSIGGASYNEIRNGAHSTGDSRGNGLGNDNSNRSSNGNGSGNSNRSSNRNRIRNSNSNSNSANDVGAAGYASYGRGMGDSGYVEKNDYNTSSREKIDVSMHKCIYNFKKFYDTWYFEYFIECKMVSFVQYFQSKRLFFLYLMKNDVELILNVFDVLCGNGSDLYFSQDEIIQLTKDAIEEDFPLIKNNFFLFKLFFDYIIEKIEYLLYNKEDLEKNYLHLFFNIIIYRSFILYYSFFFLYLNNKYVSLDKVVKFDQTIKTGPNSQKRDYIYRYNKDMCKLKKVIESHTNVVLTELSKYGFLYMVFLFFQIEKNSFERVFALLKGISLLCNETYNEATMIKVNSNNEEQRRNKGVIGKEKGGNVASNDGNNILIPLTQGGGKGSPLLEAISAKNDLSELEDISHLIKKCLKKKSVNNSIINNIYDKRWDISKKVALDLLYYIEPNLNLASFFYMFLSNYLSAYMKDPCVNKLINISNENKKNILKRISNDVDLASLTSISKDLSSFVNAKALEECLSTGPEYYRIRKDIEIILRNNYKIGNIHKDEIDKCKNVDNVKKNISLYDISLSLRNRFLNIIKSTKVNELHCIYFYVSSIVLSSTTSTSSKNEDFPSLIDKISGIGNFNGYIGMNNGGNISNNHNVITSYNLKRTNSNNNLGTGTIIGNSSSNTTSTGSAHKFLPSSYKNKVEKNNEKFSTNNNAYIDLEYPPLPEHKHEETSLTFSKSINKKKGSKDPSPQMAYSSGQVTKSKKEHSISASQKDTNNCKNKMKENVDCKDISGKNATTDYNYINFPSLPNVNNSEATKGKKGSNNKEKGTDQKKKNRQTSQASSIALKTFSADDFPYLQTLGENKKKRNPANDPSSSNQMSNIKAKDKESKNSKNRNIISPNFSQKTYLMASECNVTYTIKKKNKLKRCNMCTYENPPGRTKCELCEGPL
ncbi:hypothetical protein, conserved [Plasmodium ovale wallikeri]|uniref:RING-type domain-containing protein n=1 Tax=Plasmodium ovale wallikeri TaxID=864142 RepID=A0A1A8ZGK2_PLAOA|nr:hypothetical protein, conserved [Plasmodium ovale wallikeri]